MPAKMISDDTACKVCGIHPPRFIHGMCRSCYSKEHHKLNADKKKAKYRANIEQYREKNSLYHQGHKKEIAARHTEWRLKNKDLISEKNKELYKKTHVPTSGTNRECATFLGIHVAENVLSKVFKDIERMPPNHRGYDFICNRGMKIDVKSSTMNECVQVRRIRKCWTFAINKNIIADYFLCVAFDNRTDLNPMHCWLVPSNILCERMSVGISDSTLNKWDEYKIDINNIVECCDEIKGT